MAREAVTTADAGEHAVTLMATRCALGNVLRLAGRTNEAVDAWRQLLAGAEQTGNHLYAARIQKEIAKFEAASEAAGT